jgi:hypothetical protein
MKRCFNSESDIEEEKISTYESRSNLFFEIATELGWYRLPEIIRQSFNDPYRRENLTLGNLAKLIRLESGKKRKEKKRVRSAPLVVIDLTLDESEEEELSTTTGSMDLMEYEHNNNIMNEENFEDILGDWLCDFDQNYIDEFCKLESFVDCIF